MGRQSSRLESVLSTGGRRLKAGCSQDWLPHLAGMKKILQRLEKDYSAADNYFAQLVASEEKFQRLKSVKEFFQASVVEDLFRLPRAAVSYQ